MPIPALRSLYGPIQRSSRSRHPWWRLLHPDAGQVVFTGLALLYGALAIVLLAELIYHTGTLQLEGSPGSRSRAGVDTPAHCDIEARWRPASNTWRTAESALDVDAIVGLLGRPGSR